MEQEHNSVEEMWGNYLTHIGSNIIDNEKKYISWHFCDNEEDANNLAELTKQNIKRATSSLYYWYEIDGEGDRLLGYWREAHINFFSRELRDTW